MKSKLKTSKQKTDSTSSCARLSQTIAKHEPTAEFSLTEDAPSYEIKRGPRGYYFQWEPLQRFPCKDADRIDVFKSIASLLYPFSLNEDRQLVIRARDVFVALAAYLFDNYEDELRLDFPCCKSPAVAMIRRMTWGETSSEITMSYHVKMLSQRKFLSEQTKQLFEPVLLHDNDMLELVMNIVREPAMAQLTLH
jgi:hypothetical protein